MILGDLAILLFFASLALVLLALIVLTLTALNVSSSTTLLMLLTFLLSLALMGVVVGLNLAGVSFIDSGILVITIGLLFGALSVVVLSLVWLERKVLGRIQMRMGPMRVGPYGTLQSLADAIKLVTKEDIRPDWADARVFWVAPVLVFVPIFMIWLAIPFSPEWITRPSDLGLFYIVAFLVTSIVGLVMAGWGSANKYAVLGGLRAAGQLISYEIPIIMVAAAVAILAQSLDLSKIVEAQNPVPFALLMPLGFFLFFVAGLAELGRTPFDIYEADSEVVGGPFVEYSGPHWSIFFLAEYVNTFGVSILIAILFLGGWNWSLPLQGLVTSPWSDLIAMGEVIFKTYLVVIVIFWIRGTFPRLRIDQLMALGWKGLVPLSFAVVLLNAGYLFHQLPAWSLILSNIIILLAFFTYLFRQAHNNVHPPTIRLYSARELRNAR
jgi:NADH-quinone oxidoreductase subunit H